MKAKEYLKSKGLPVPESSINHTNDCALPDKLSEAPWSVLVDQLAKWGHFSNVCLYQMATYKHLEGEIKDMIEVKKAKKEDIIELKRKLGKAKMMQNFFELMYKIYQQNYRTVSRIVEARKAESMH